MKTTPRRGRAPRGIARTLSVTALLAGLVVTTWARAQALELPPPEGVDGEQGEEVLAEDATRRSAAKETETKSTPAPSLEEESASAPGEQAEAAPIAEQGAEDGKAAAVPHDKPADSGHGGGKAEAPRAQGTGLYWFAGAFAVLLVAVFVFT